MPKSIKKRKPRKTTTRQPSPQPVDATETVDWAAAVAEARAQTDGYDLARRLLEIGRSVSTSAAQMFLLGEYLSHMKEELAHGEFGTWLEAEGLADRTARKYMAFVRRMERWTRQNGTLVPFSTLTALMQGEAKALPAASDQSEPGSTGTDESDDGTDRGDEHDTENAKVEDVDAGSDATREETDEHETENVEDETADAETDDGNDEQEPEDVEDDLLEDYQQAIESSLSALAGAYDIETMEADELRALVPHLTEADEALKGLAERHAAVKARVKSRALHIRAREARKTA